MTTEPVDWNFPTQMAVGPGRIAELPEFCQQQGIRAPLIVTDPGLAALPMVAAIKTACDDAGMTSGVFAEGLALGHRRQQTPWASRGKLGP